MSADKRIQEFIAAVIKRLETYGNCLYLTDSLCGISPKKTNVQTDGDYDPEIARIIAKLNDEEAHYRFVIYKDQPNNPVWSKICSRQSDCVYFIGFSDDHTFLQDNRRNIFLASDKPRSRVVLILLHANKNQLPKATNFWLSKLPVDDFYHIAREDDVHLNRIARIISGNSTALVLSGGGARAMAHIGLLQP